MGLKMSNVLVAFVIVTMLSNLMFSYIDAFYTAYDLTPSNLQDINNDGNPISIMAAFNNMTFSSGIQTFVDALYNIANPGSILDILGGLAAAGIGALKITTGIIVAPIEIIDILLKFYVGIPMALSIAIKTTFTIYIGFILIKNYTGQEN
jgi:hypothetical protein